MEKRRTTITSVGLTHNQHFDLIIIGGGINGAAVARDASLRGLSVCLLEKETLGHGTSSKSSKLAHGGLRYLEQFQFAMVKETLTERDLLFKNAPQYTNPLECLLPVYHHSNRPLWQIRIGLWLYSKLATQSKLPPYRMLSKDDVIAECPLLTPHQLSGGAIYFDGQLMDYELVVANAQDAIYHGAVIAEHTPVTDILKKQGTVSGVTVSHQGQSLQLLSSRILNVSGPWGNEVATLDTLLTEPLVAPTKGVHLVVKALPIQQALTLQTPQDHRVFFIIPWKENTLIGTTDTPYFGHPDAVSVDEEDITYLLDACNAYFTSYRIKKSDIVEQFAGLRPLHYSTKKASNRSRDFICTQSKSKLFHMIGGKYTSYRHMAEVALDTILKQVPPTISINPCSTATRPLP